MGSSSWQPGISPDRRVTPDRRVPQSVHCQESLARIVVETRGADSHAGRALQELARRRAEQAEPATGEDMLIIYSLRGQWLVGTVREIRETATAAAAAACRRSKEVPLAVHARPETVAATAGDAR